VISPDSNSKKEGTPLGVISLDIPTLKQLANQHTTRCDLSRLKPTNRWNGVISFDSINKTASTPLGVISLDFPP
jgi:L,D-peptidoglycan transpeptidase YkuD (ErfK/YbiS/YcfS/YnhG family)